jgi:tetratricopeptide (TPR) repeat protein
VSNDYNALVPLINSMERLGRMADAERLRRKEMEVLQEQLRHFPDDVRARILLAADLAIFGDKKEAAMQARIAIAMQPKNPNILYNAACTYGLLDMRDEALDAFRRSVDAGYLNLDWCLKDPDLKILHDDAEFLKLVNERSAIARLGANQN